MALHSVRHSYIAKVKKGVSVNLHHLKHSTRLLIIRFLKGLQKYLVSYGPVLTLQLPLPRLKLSHLYLLLYLSKFWAEHQFAGKYLFTSKFFVCHGALEWQNKNNQLYI